MNSPLRAALLLAAVLGIATVVILSARKPLKPAATTGERALSAPEVAPVAPVLSKLAVPEAVLSPPQAVASAAAEIPTEDSLAAAMHALEDSAPERALELARRGQALWPAGARVPEFAATEVKCLYRLGKPSEGRGAAEAMVNKYPTSPWALEVERQTGAHPYVNH